MTSPGNAAGVFLSYASQDADAARRICDALRAVGIEVWLDQTELRGGDAWDQRIRHQVRECVLFLPIISSQTQSRKEGYFRLEWRLAVERMQRMSDGAAFLVPVVIDKTSEHSANVPEVFKSVQWARLPGGDTPKPFVDLILSLIDATKAEAAEDYPTPATTSARSPPTSVRRKSRSGSWVAVAAVVASALVAVLYLGYRISGASQSSVAANTSVTALSIIVLPFANQTGDSQKDYIADALTSSITSSVARIRDAYVVPAQTAYTYKDKALSVQQVARDAGVQFVLSGNVQTAGAQARIRVQLSGGAGAATLWNETFNGDLNDLFELEDRVAAQVANSLGREMVIAADRDKGKLAENAESADLLLRARALGLQSFSFDNQKEIEQIHRTVLAREPDNAVALTGLAIILTDSAVLGLYTPRSLDMQRRLIAEAEKLAERAREIAPGPIELQAVFGVAALFRADFESAERIFNAMREQRPQYPGTYNWLGVLAYARYEPSKALEFFKRAADLSPGQPRDYFLLNNALAYLELGDYDAAIENLEKLLARNPRLDVAFALAAVAYSLRGNDAAAATWAAKGREAHVIPSDVLGFPVGAEAYEKWADAVLRPTWRRLGLHE